MLNAVAKGGGVGSLRLNTTWELMKSVSGLIDTFNPARSGISAENGFWLSGENDKGEIVCTSAARIYYWPDTNLAEQAVAMWYGRDEGQPCVVTADMAESAQHRAEEARFLEDMPGVLGPRAMGALAEIVLAPPQVAEQARLGWLTEPDDPVALARTLAAAEAMGDADLRAMGARGRQFALATFSPAHVAARTLAVYSTLFEGAAAG